MKPRGIIITPSYKLTNDGFVTEWIGIEPTYLRKCVTYWDIMDCPESIIGGSPLGEEENEIKLLEKEGIFRRTRGHLVKREGEQFILTFGGEYPREFWTLAQLYTYIKYSNSDPFVDWSLSQPSETLLLPELPISDFIFIEPGANAHAMRIIKSLQDNLCLGPSVTIDIQNALPTPSIDTPIDKVLEFKRKRYPELQNFRHAIDEFELSIVKSNDIPRAKNYVIDEIDLALRDIEKVMNEGKLRRFMSNIKVNVSISEFAAPLGVVIGSVISHKLPLVDSALIGATAAAVIKIAVTQALKPRSIPNERKDYAYLYYVKKEL